MANSENKKGQGEAQKPICGVIMPISPVVEYPDSHWQDVKCIVFEAVINAGFQPNMVNEDDAIGLIHDRIVTNIYNNEMIVCDVSSKNPNVMFELGLRLAFDKPTIIIKDDKTDYSFDTGVIEHLSYPSTLRYAQINSFKEELSNRITATYDKKTNDSNYSPFLRSFGKTIDAATLESSAVSLTEFISSQMSSIRREFQQLQGSQQGLPFDEQNIRIPHKGKLIIYKHITAAGSKTILLREIQRLDDLHNELISAGIGISYNALVAYLANIPV